MTRRTGRSGPTKSSAQSHDNSWSRAKACGSVGKERSPIDLERYEAPQALSIWKNSAVDSSIASWSDDDVSKWISGTVVRNSSA